MPVAKQTIAEIIADRAQSSPDAIFLRAPNRAPLSAQRLDDLIHATRARLVELGIAPGDRVALALENGPEAASAFLATASAATCAPLNPGYKRAEFDFYLSDLGAAALIVAAGGSRPAVEAARALGVAVFELSVRDDAAAGVFELTGEPVARAAPAAVRRDRPGPEDEALVLHTSGTTSRPKVVPLSQRNLCTSALEIGATLCLEPTDRCLNVMPLFHIHGLVGVLLSSLHAGASVVALPGFSASGFFAGLAEFETTWYSAVPTMHQAVLAYAQRRPELVGRSRLRLIRSSSSALPPSMLAELERTFGVPVVEAYGMTEAAHQMACNPLPPRPRKPGSVGPAAGPEIRILDADWQVLSTGEVGEVAIRGASVTAGYEANPEANRAAFQDGWFRTGDQGYLDADGYLFLTGRLKEIINRAGEKISPREIDEVLLEHPAVAQAVAFARPHPTLGEDVAAAIVLREGEAVDPRELQAFAAERLTDFKLPREIVFVDEIPKGPTGKLQRIGLARQLGLGEPSVTATTLGPGAGRAPATPTEVLVAGLFSELLEADSVAAESEFFALGGDSLLAGRLIQRLTASTGIALPVYELFEQPSVARLAAWLDAAEPAPLQAEPFPDAGTGPHPLSCAQQGLWVQERLSGGSPLNHRFGALRLSGTLDSTALERALDGLVRMHAVLRTRFPIQERRPVQRVEPSARVELTVHDWRSQSARERDASRDARVHELVTTPFDLEAGPVYRFELARLTETESVLLSVFHHIAFDGWSMSVLTTDLARLYQAALEGAEPPAAAPRYADYAAWQHGLLERGVLDGQLEYWRRVLAARPEPLELPGARPRPAQLGPRELRGRRVDVIVSAAAHAGLTALSRSHGATLFMALLAAFDALLQRWSGRADLSVGTVVAGRTRPETTGQIGLFTNTLVLRSDGSDDPTFRELLLRTRQVALAAYANADVPFEVVVRELKPQVVLGRNPFFDVLFQLRNLPPAHATSAGLVLDELALESGYARFDLLVEAFEHDGRLHTRFEYRTERFDQGLMSRWCARWVRLLETVASDPDVRISQIELDDVGRASDFGAS